MNNGHPLSRQRRKPFVPTRAQLRSSISNGSELLHHLDHRSAWARRLRDLIVGHEQDLGGRDLLSEAQIALVRRVAVMQLQLELMEQRFADNDGEATPNQLHRYQSCSMAMRRICESLQLNRGRKAREVMSPLAYAESKRLEAERQATP
jgi:hypothetical protein